MNIHKGLTAAVTVAALSLTVAALEDSSAAHGAEYLRHGRHVTLPIRPCKVEDSGTRCFWDAGVRGNGHGYSFWRDAGGHKHFLDVRVTRAELCWLHACHTH